MSDPIRAAIVSKLKSVPGIGTVQPFQRYADDMEKLSEFYMDGGLLLGWFIRRVGVKEGRIGTKYPEVSKWEITGYRALVDADESDLLFNELVDAIRAAFRADEWPDLPKAVNSRVSEDESGVQVDELGLVMFAGILCHSAKLTLTVNRYI